jgi:hypothetical protein
MILPFLSPLTCVYKNQARIIDIKKKKEKDFTIRIESREFFDRES